MTTRQSHHEISHNQQYTYYSYCRRRDIAKTFKNFSQKKKEKKRREFEKILTLELEFLVPSLFSQCLSFLIFQIVSDMLVIYVLPAIISRVLIHR